jgi:DNA polymerase III subunit epsilon
MRRFLKRTYDWHRLQDRSYEFLFEPPPDDEVVSIDCETTGLNPRKDDVISIAAIRIKGKRILTSECFRATVKPQAQMAADSIKVHQIRKSEAAQGWAMGDILPGFLKFIGSRPLVGYWIDFDAKMLNKGVQNFIKISLPNPRIDVCDLYYDRKYGNAPPNTKLDLKFASILQDLHLPPLQAHDAFNDALSTAEMYVILKDLKQRGVYLKRNRTIDMPSAPLG